MADELHVSYSQVWHFLPQLYHYSYLLSGGSQVEGNREYDDLQRKNILTRLLLGLTSSKKCGKRWSHLNVISGDVNPIESRINSMKSHRVLLDSFCVFENYCKLYFVSVQSWSWKINYAIDTNSLIFLTIL